MKDKPFLTSALIFGAISVLLLALSAVIFLMKDDSFCDNLGKLLGMSPDSISTSTIAELSVICTVPSFIFAFKSLSEE